MGQVAIPIISLQSLTTHTAVFVHLLFIFLQGVRNWFCAHFGSKLAELHIGVLNQGTEALQLSYLHCWCFHHSFCVVGQLGQNPLLVGAQGFDLITTPVMCLEVMTTLSSCSKMWHETMAKCSVATFVGPWFFLICIDNKLQSELSSRFLRMNESLS